MKTVFTIVLLFGATFSAHAGTSKGDDLIVECKAVLTLADGGHITDEESAKAAHCLGIVAGVRDTLMLWTGSNRMEMKSIASCACIPNDVSNIQATRIVVKYLEDNPEELNQLDTGLVAVALRKAYPCKTR